jgi:hypothetical protein
MTGEAAKADSFAQTATLMRVFKHRVRCLASVYRALMCFLLVGEYVNSLKHGYGVFVYGEEKWKGDRYEVHTHTHFTHSRGHAFDKSCSRLIACFFAQVSLHHNLTFTQGMHANDKKEGKGTYYFSNGDRYEGLWKDDKVWFDWSDQVCLCITI